MDEQQIAKRSSRMKEIDSYSKGYIGRSTITEGINHKA
jgi:hypothetical protein